MKLAILIQCHKNPEQINVLLDTLDNPNIDIFMHIDKKSVIDRHIKTKNKNVYILPISQRVDVGWGLFSQVEATLNLLNYAVNNGSYDFYWLISGQDFPLVNSDSIISYLNSNTNKNFINLFKSKNNGARKNTNYDKRNEIIFPQWMMKQFFFYRILRRFWVEISGGYEKTFSIFKRKDNNHLKYYFGSQWWCINKDFVRYLLHSIESNYGIVEFYKCSSCPDESFFQTLLMNSKFSETREEYLHYIDWSKGGNSPKNLTCEDLDKMFSSGKMMARKIDSNVDKNIIKEIVKRISK